MECEICGKREASVVVVIEGAKLNVCNYCAGDSKVVGRFGQSIGGSKERPREARPRRREEEEAVLGYGKKIREAREKIGMKLEGFAQRINEMASYIDRIEKEETSPPIKVLRKIEKTLDIKLVEKVGAEITPSHEKGKIKELTLLELLEMEKEKKGK
ncbi:TIGR00270 family protein [Candidatus Micrarchaeota archaeon]|nr:TIGR00270 family protein [Candidatus Micrarchaeota archaeon]